jgi:hypothetical protein
MSDITLVIEFLKTEAPDLYDEIKSSDQDAAQALLSGFIAYGWTHAEILETKSPLFDELRRYISLEDQYFDEREVNLSAASSTPPLSGTPEIAMSQVASTPTIGSPSPLELSFLSNVQNCMGLPTATYSSTVDSFNDHQVSRTDATWADIELDPKFLQTDVEIMSDVYDMADSQQCTHSLGWSDLFGEFN